MKPAKARECVRSRAAACCCARSVEITSIDTCNTLHATFCPGPLPLAGRRPRRASSARCSLEGPRDPACIVRSEADAVTRESRYSMH
jgi:hypothetical protein